ncbi:YitT family protein [Vagococcus xieshaowenii]|uniref:YitT family protein n=1 Tax=Vagococcus xieshaowenii TaxID=2562451 RepID=A0AAJ5JLR0_9ENTE|nr:YitT family protein [Vagococcus xieshaowenii]QCA28439.1 YitT family protein [Vagococcus xieshaowenii]TFZ42805.1 YitT family protein [Vagococcus xieshaowenii]
MSLNIKTIVKNLLLITLGTLIFSIAVNSVAIPNELGEGGVTGITLILYYLKQIPTAFTNIFFNTILLVAGWKLLDRSTIYYTIYAVFLMSVFLKLTEGFQYYASEGATAAILAGILMGVGIGLVMKGEGTTAGSVILAKMIHKYTGWRVSYVLLLLDMVVVFASYKVIGLEKIILTLLSLYISTKVLDFMLEGTNAKKTVMVISDHYDEIAKAISTEINRGVTMMDGVGYYKQTPKKILYVVISRDQLVPIQKLIATIDPLAFVTINDVQNVIGEGFSRESLPE